jgi:putative Ca2+/H+ antiporter (TMEM165/GDT1 family)
MGFEAFGATFALIFLAELGDKTQLAVMALCSRHPWRKVLLGTALAFTVLNCLAVGVGRFLTHLANPVWIQGGAGVLFCGFGLWTFFGNGEEDEEAKERQRKSLVWTSFLMIFVAELGDKTQLATAGMAARYDAPAAVFAGSTLALILVSGIGAVFGKNVLARLPERWVKAVSGCVFIVFGLLAIWGAVRAS